MVKIPFVPRSLFVQSFFSPLRADPPGGDPTSAPGGDKPESLRTACTCIRCRLTVIHGDLLRIACNAPSVVESPVVEVAHKVFNLLRHESGPCTALQEIRRRIDHEADISAGLTQGRRLRAIAGDLKLYIEKGN